MNEQPLDPLETLGMDEYIEPPAVFMQDVSVKRRSLDLLHDMELWVDEGDSLGILGPTGAGKTLLLALMMGFIKPTTGTVELFGKKPRRLNKRAYPIGYLPSCQPVPNHFPATVLDVVLMGAYAAQSRFRPLQQRHTLQAHYLLSQFKLEYVQNHAIGSISAAEQQRVFLARALVCKPRLLILDNPLTGLDPAGQEQLLALLHECKEQWIFSIVCATTSPKFAVTLCDTILCLNRTIHWFGHAEDLNKETVKQLFQCDVDFRKLPRRANRKKNKAALSKVELLARQGKEVLLPEL
jgi:zinc transport system ATP-binding protein